MAKHKGSTQKQWGLHCYTLYRDLKGGTEARMKEIDFVKKRIHELMEYHRISERQLSKMIGKSPNYSHEMTDLSKPNSCLPMIMFFKALAAFRVSPARFFDEMDPNPSLTQKMVEQAWRLTNNNEKQMERYIRVMEKISPDLLDKILDLFDTKQ